MLLMESENHDEAGRVYIRVPCVNLLTFGGQANVNPRHWPALRTFPKYETLILWLKLRYCCDAQPVIDLSLGT